ncbi:hypothetical protein BHM03_00002386 [Ensete ventricosum]|nr:hypothetical protein BHM03_00002386 [Ensete ventricosum]
MQRPSSASSRGTITTANRRWTLPPLSPLAASAFLTYFCCSQPSVCHSFPSLLLPPQSARRRCQRQERGAAATRYRSCF